MSKSPHVSESRSTRIDEGLSSLVKRYFPLPKQDDRDRNPDDHDPDQDDRDRENYSSGFKLVKSIIEGYFEPLGHFGAKC